MNSQLLVSFLHTVDIQQLSVWCYIVLEICYLAGSEITSKKRDGTKKNSEFTAIQQNQVNIDFMNRHHHT
jgi:hypothetical protein